MLCSLVLCCVVCRFSDLAISQSILSDLVNHITLLYHSPGPVNQLLNMAMAIIMENMAIIQLLNMAEEKMENKSRGPFEAR